MVSKLVIGSVALIAVGLVLVVVGNPSLRLVTGATPSGTTFTFTGTTFTFTRTSGFNGTFPFNFTRPAGTVGGRGSLTTDEVESLAGVALLGAGLLLEVFSVFIRPRPVSAPA